MKFEIEVDNDELAKSIQALLVKRAVDEIEGKIFFEEYTNNVRNVYKKDVHAEMLKMIREHEAEVIEKAVAEAASILARKAMPKMVERLVKGDSDA